MAVKPDRKILIAALAAAREHAAGMPVTPEAYALIVNIIAALAIAKELYGGPD